jgi:hypothetical protein
MAQLRCLDAARAAARLAARHDSAATIMSVARTAAPDGATVAVSQDGDLVRVQIVARLALPLPGHPALMLRASSTAALEPGWSG